MSRTAKGTHQSAMAAAAAKPQSPQRIKVFGVSPRRSNIFFERRSNIFFFVMRMRTMQKKKGGEETEKKERETKEKKEKQEKRAGTEHRYIGYLSSSSISIYNHCLYP